MDTYGYLWIIMDSYGYLDNMDILGYDHWIIIVLDDIGIKIHIIGIVGLLTIENRWDT